MNLLVLGGAVTGSAVARLARRLGHPVVVYDRSEAVLASLAADGFPTVGGDWSQDLLTGVDLVVTSPGIPEHAPPIRETMVAGVPLISEVEFAARHLQAPVVAVTGTNGKTTVTGLIADALVQSGIAGRAAGNIGLALSDLVGDEPDVAVVEVSSFQLRFVDGFHPVVAVVLNVAPDHLDWHGTMEAYARAKARITERQVATDRFVYDADDAGATAIAEVTVAERIPVSGRRVPDGGAGRRGGLLVVGDVEVPVADLAVDDPGYLADLSAAGVAAARMGATTPGIEAALRRFRPGPHRRTVVGTWSGTSWVDDSKATNPHAAAAAAGAYDSVILIAGGRNKGLDLAPLAGVPSVRHIIALGEAAPEIVAVTPADRVTVVESLADAVGTADRLARPGDTVLLAPGCASFDMFSSYAERGDAFAQAVRARKERAWA